MRPTLELRAAEKRVTDVLKQEEERFFQTIATGMEISKVLWRKALSMATPPSSCIDTYGFPVT